MNAAGAEASLSGSQGPGAPIIVQFAAMAYDQPVRRFHTLVLEDEPYWLL
jgi:hypothetical protein